MVSPAVTAAMRRPPPAALLAAAGVVLLVGGLFLLDRVLAGRGVPDWVSLAGVSFSARDDDAVRAAIEDAAPKLEAATVTARAGDDSEEVSAESIGYDLDAEATFQAINEVGAPGPFGSLRAALGWRPAPVEIGWVATWDTERLEKEVARLAKAFDRKPRNGTIGFDGGEVSERAPRSGRQLIEDQAGGQIVAAFARPGSEVELPFATEAPPVGEEAVAEAAGRARALLDGPVTIDVADSDVELPPARLATAMTVKADGDKLAVGVDPDKLHEALGGSLASHEREAVSASFTVSGGKVKLTPAKDGNQVDVEALAGEILGGSRTVKATLTPSEPELTTAEARKLGISKPISSFTTNFPAGQPRVRNIVRGSQIIQDSLILPGEQFSLNEALGPRTRGRGFVEAPAIFKGEFVKDVGGGVSQIATTFFNAVFFAGRQIDEYKAHTYYISRYPLGREATISNPAPDLKFTNDSEYGILVRTATTATSVTVTFYSTPDGREVEAEGPKVIKKRPRGVEYVTDPEKVAEGHDGYDVEVFRVIRRPGQPTERERFFTRYDVDDDKVLRQGG